MKQEIMILIVDDNGNFIDRIINLIEDSENIASISTASNFEEARLFLDANDPNIVLLDINLPGKNGLEILKIIKKKKKDCEVIMLTNHADEYYKTQCQELGAKHFLDKSNDFLMVPSLIDQYCEQVN